MEISFHRFELPLRHIFRISRGSVTVQETLIVELRAAGQAGYGEATTNSYYGATYANMTSALEALRGDLQVAPNDLPESLWDQLQPRLAAIPFAHCALDQAAHDLAGKIHGQSVLRMWGLRPDHLVPSSFTIGIDSLDTMIAKLQETPDWPIYKIKLGTEYDLEIVRRIREHTPVPLRIDANCAWSVLQTLRNAEALRELGVEFIEQPLPASDRSGQAEVFANSALPIVADESCVVEEDVDRCAGLFHGVNVKAVKCGGLTPARRMLLRARDLGLKTMIGCMTESTVGISAIAQLLPLVDFADIDGAALLAADIAEGVRIERGQCQFPPTPGTGVRLTGALR